MQDHFNFSDSEFENQFYNCTLHSALFTHEAHLRLAWIHLNKYGIETALLNVSGQILNFVDHAGKKDKYHHTITMAAVKAVWHFKCQSSSDNFIDFMSEFPRLKYNFKELMAAHYKIDLFCSEIAKYVFIEPDLLPFD